MMFVKSCLISRSVPKGDSDEEKILSDMKPVSVYKNIILDLIMENRMNWHSNPTICVDGSVYKLKLLELTETYAVMYQSLILPYRKHNGKEWYDILSRRKVKIFFQ